MGLVHAFKRWTETALGVRIYRTGTPLGLDLNNDLKRLVPQFHPRIILDVGANVGQTALHFHSLWRDAQIYSFEPVSETYAKLVQAVVGREANIHCERVAFSDESGQADIHLSRNSLLATLSPSPTLLGSYSGEKETVRTSTVQDWCDAKGVTEIDLLKVDAEGHDLRVLQGAASMLEQQKIGAILVEVHMGPDADPTPDAFRRWLHQYDYVLCGIYDQGGWVSKRKFRGNFLFLPSRMLLQ